MYCNNSSVIKTRCVLQRKAFSLMELMVVIVILGLLAATVSFGVQKYLLMGKQTAAKTDIAKIKQTLGSFYALKDRYPSQQEGLQILVAEGFLEGDLKDPWGNDYGYFPTSGDNDSFEVICFGADGRDGGSGKNADISSKELNATT